MAQTPGPWEWANESVDMFDNTLNVRGSKSYHGGLVSGGELIASITNGHIANARLIAAAPELLEALRAYVAVDVMLRSVGLLCETGELRLAAADAAIAKAEMGL